MNATASLPSAVSTCCIAASEPTASPSGRSCVVRQKRSCSRIARSTSSRDDSAPLEPLIRTASSVVEQLA